uniref:Uncharacterized protein n=1 Tax=Homalodisca liturata TaxID=320908 RepID=A0A1B6ISW7_9HEMI
MSKLSYLQQQRQIYPEVKISTIITPHIGQTLPFLYNAHIYKAKPLHALQTVKSTATGPQKTHRKGPPLEAQEMVDESSIIHSAGVQNFLHFINVKFLTFLMFLQQLSLILEDLSCIVDAMTVLDVNFNKE